MKTRVYALALWFAFALSNAATAVAQLPSGWTDQDIGTCSPAGSATYASGTFTVNGAGAGVNGTSDNLNFCYQTFTGPFTLTARVTSNSGFSGVMLRESLAPNAREHLIYAFASGSTGLMNIWTKTRTTSGGSAAIYSGPAYGFPFWVKLQRAGNVLYSFDSPDGVHWNQKLMQTLPNLASSVYVGLAVSYNNNGTLKTTTFDNVSLQPIADSCTVPGTVKQSWIGNTYGNGPACQEMQNTITGMYVAPDGTCYANTSGQEVARMWGVYKSGTTVGFISGQGRGGAAITGDATYVYIAQQIAVSGTNYYGLSRFNKTTFAPAPFAGSLNVTGSNILMIGLKSGTTGLSAPGNVWGLACNTTANTLYASDTINGSIKLIDLSTMAVSGTWTLPSGYQPYGLCWDSTDSLLWVIVQNTLTGARQVWAYNNAGVQQPALTITAAAYPVSIAQSPYKLYVADDGPDQNIKAFLSISTAPYLWIYYGTIGGSFSGTGATIGTTGDWRLNGINAIGCDNSGNIYVSCTGDSPDLNEDNAYHDYGYGGTLESYSAGTRALNWRMKGLEFFDVVRIDPGDETSAYGNATHYKLDWSKTTPGSEWSAVGNTLNPWKYPSDFRFSASNTNFPTMQMIRIAGQKFVCISNNYTLTFYRFNTATDGETAIPCAQFITRTTDAGHTGLAIWTDKPGADGKLDGVRQTSETEYAGSGLATLDGAYIDSNGTLWSPNGATVIKFPCTLSSNGVPQYTWASRSSVTFASLPGGPNNDHLTNVTGDGACLRVYYDLSSDTMYILGYSVNYPNSTPKSQGAGTVVICYTNWSTSPVFAWESVLPVHMTGNIQTSFMPEAMTAAGKYLFVQFIQGEQTLVLSKATGDQVGSLYPDRTIIGAIGWCDFPHGVSAFQRANGEYIITVEDDCYGKSLMYRWTGAP